MCALTTPLPKHCPHWNQGVNLWKMLPSAHVCLWTQWSLAIEGVNKYGRISTLNIIWVVKICGEPSAFKFHPGLLSISTIISDAMKVNFWLIFNYYWFLFICFIFNLFSLPNIQRSCKMTFLCLKCWLLLSMKESAFFPKPFIPDSFRNQVPHSW